MENRVYYGEYSLRHWIDLLLKKNLILPEYQRHFVWNEEQVKTLISALKNKLFVPPITIGAFKIENNNENLILDGQQRLTSILLAYLGLYPNEKTYKDVITKFADEDDNEGEPAEEFENILKWTFKAFTQIGNNKKTILDGITDESYKKIDFNVNDDFLNKTFLGFSYLVPSATGTHNYQKYYSSVFRNINIQGVSLLAQESRASLYFLDKELVPFFDPDFLKNFTVKNLGGADFVRYLALLSQYKKDGNSGRIARGYKPKMEKYYEEYIYSVVGENDSKMFVDFLSVFPEKKYVERFKLLKDTISALQFPKQFNSIIDLDMYFFGLIYEIVFENKKIVDSKKIELKKDLDDKINEFKNDPSHTKAPSALKYLKSRIDKSVEIYKKHTSA